MTMTTKTKSGIYRETPWSITITKSGVNTYTAMVIVELITHAVEIKFPAGNKPGMCNSRNPSGSGSYLNENPYLFVVDFIVGFIDGRLERTDKMLGSGQYDEFNKKIESEKITMKQKTEIPEAQIKEMRKQVDLLVDTFGAVGIVHLVARADRSKIITVDSVYKWRKRGRISATMAHLLCKEGPAKDAGFTREALRPDVKTWIKMDYPINEQ